MPSTAALLPALWLAASPQGLSPSVAFTTTPKVERSVIALSAGALKGVTLEKTQRTELVDGESFTLVSVPMGVLTEAPGLLELKPESRAKVLAAMISTLMNGVGEALFASLHGKVLEEKALELDWGRGKAMTGKVVDPQSSMAGLSLLAHVVLANADLSLQLVVAVTRSDKEGRARAESFVRSLKLVPAAAAPRRPSSPGKPAPVERPPP